MRRELTLTLRVHPLQPPALRARQGHFLCLLAHPRLMFAWFVALESIRMYLRQAVLLVMQDHTLQRRQLPVRPVLPANTLRQELLIVLYVLVENTPRYHQLSAHLVTLEGIRAR